MSAARASHLAAGATLLVLALACSETTDPDLRSGTSLVFTLDLQQAVEAGYNVTRVHVTVSNSDHSAELDLTVGNTTATGKFENLPVGQYDISVNIYEGDNVVATGIGKTTVQPGTTVTAAVEVTFTAGDLIIIVSWGPTADIPLLLSPAEGDVLDNGCSNRSDPTVWDFNWTDVAGAEFYHLHVQGASATIPLINVSALPRSEFQSARTGGYIVDQNRYSWYWKVRAMVDGVWNDWTDVRHFDVEPLNRDCS